LKGKAPKLLPRQRCVDAAEDDVHIAQLCEHLSIKHIASNWHDLAPQTQILNPALNNFHFWRATFDILTGHIQNPIQVDLFRYIAIDKNNPPTPGPSYQLTDKRTGSTRPDNADC
jgi:hypothetical protein